MIAARQRLVGQVPGTLDYKSGYRELRPYPVSLAACRTEATDCSGYVTLLYKAAGLPDPNGNKYNGYGNTATLEAQGSPVLIPRPGDLAFWRDPDHVAMVLSDGNQIVQWGGPPGPSLSTLGAEDHYHASFIGFRSYIKTMLTISPAGLDLIKSEEGFRATPYNLGDGTLTIGYGTTKEFLNPLPNVVTEAEASALVERYLAERVYPTIYALGVPLNQNQFDALCDFCYNLGAGELAASHTIGADLREGRFSRVADDFLLYDDPGTRFQAGLLSRRQKERELWLAPVNKPKPVENAHYDWFTPAQLAVVKAYDDAKVAPRLNRREMNALRAELKRLRNAVWLRAHLRKPPDWSDHRGFQFQQLNARYNGKRVV